MSIPNEYHIPAAFTAGVQRGVAAVNARIEFEAPAAVVIGRQGLALKGGTETRCSHVSSLARG